MTLQELHELTGKVLKERPELSNFEVEDCSEQTIKGIGQYKLDITNEVITILNEASCLFDEELLVKGEWAWQAN